MSKTPLPWTIYDTADPLKIGIKGFDRKVGGMHVATVIMPENAELIVKAVNSHDGLVKALQEIENTAEGHQCRIKARQALIRVGGNADGR